jgi:hypothetical protein
MLLLAVLATVCGCGDGFSTEACVSVQLSRVHDGEERNNLGFFHYIPEHTINGHSVYAGFDEDDIGVSVYYMPNVSILTAEGNTTLRGWAIDQERGSYFPAVVLSDCDETVGNMGPDTCGTVHARLTGRFYNSKILAQEQCLACNMHYYLAYSLLSSSHCLKKHSPGEQCWQQD